MISAEHIINTIGAFIGDHQMLNTLIESLGLIVLSFGIFRFIFRREMRIYKNLKRKIYIFTFGSDNFTDTEKHIQNSHIC